MKHTTLVGALSSVALAVGLAAGGYGIASAASSSPAHATSGGTVPGPVYGGPGGHSGFGGRGGFGGPGGPGRGPGFGGGVITSVGSGSITIQRPNGTSQTVTTTPSTTYERDGAASSRSALAVGERIQLRPVHPATSSSGSPTPPTSSSSSTPAVAEVNVIDPSISGKVESMRGSVLIIQDQDGFYRTINLTGSTTYTNAGKSADATALATGDPVVATGTVNANHTSLDALKVAVNPVRPSGPPNGFNPGNRPPSTNAG